jgi:Fanconi anemia group M protein
MQKENKKPIIIIDKREPEKYAYELKNFDCVIEQKILEIGDFEISNKIIIERKTKADFVSSIIDQRIFYQLNKMTQNYEKVVLIIEEDKAPIRIHKNAYFGAISSIIVDFNASVIFLEDYKQTCNFLYSLARYEQISPKIILKANPTKNIKTLPKAQLSLIESLPNVGPKTAKELLEVFKTPINIFNCTQKELSDIKNIGKEKAKKIREVLDSVYKG